jgi:hypothetical protein
MVWLGFSPLSKELISSAVKVGTREGISVSLPLILTPMESSVEIPPPGLSSVPKYPGPFFRGTT